ncbi:MAG: hypothetical protein QOD92_4277 [Acidimicrobiaceae bacterium]
MKSTFRRVVAAFSLVTLITVIAASPSNAANAPTGVGSTGGGATLVSLRVGELTNIVDAQLVRELNGTSIDSALATPNAFQSLSALVATSDLLDLSSVNTPEIRTETEGAQKQQVTDLLKFEDFIDPAILSGSVNPATLVSVLDAAGARSSLNSTLTDVSVLSGVANVDSSALTITGNSSPTEAVAGRNVVADGITVLNLGMLLDVLGLSLDDLSLQQIFDLVIATGSLDAIADALHIPLDLVQVAVAPVLAQEEFVAAKQTAVDDANDALTSCLADLVNCLDQAGLEADLADAEAALASAQGILDIMLAPFAELAAFAVNLLSGTPLVQVGKITAGAVATARDTVPNSAATTGGRVESVQIAGLDPVGPIDLADGQAAVDAAVAELNGSLSSILSIVDPDLANLLQLELLSHDEQLGVEAGYVKSLANITGLAVTITPPNLCDVYENLDVHQFPVLNIALDDAPSAAPLLEELGLTQVCEVPQNVAELTSDVQPNIAVPLVEVTTAALTEPLSFQTASVGSTAEFKVAAAPAVPETPALPRTGMNETLLLVIGGLMAAVALGLRRASAPVKVRANRIKQ